MMCNQINSWKLAEGLCVKYCLAEIVIFVLLELNQAHIYIDAVILSNKVLE